VEIILEPRLETEKEDVHLIRTFLFSTKPTKNPDPNYDFNVSRENGHTKAKEYLGTDFGIIPHRIFAPLEEGRGGHVASGSYEEELKELKDNSHGKIEKLYGPFYYEDSPKDYWYEAGIKLSGSKAASVLVDNGSKTWTKFAVSPHIWSHEGSNNLDVIDYKPMGLFLVIKGSYGDQAVIKKMCSGSELKCGMSLAASIQTMLDNKTTPNEDNIAETLNSFINLKDSNSVKMETQQVEKFTEPFQAKEVPVVKTQTVSNTTPIQNKTEEVVTKLEETQKGITISNEEFEAYKKEREEHKQLVLENKTNKLNTLFNVVEDEEAKTELVKKYIGEDVNLLVKFSNDLLPHVEKFNKGKEVKVEEEGKSKASAVISTSTLKDEPKKEEGESKASAVVPNKVNEVLDFSQMFEGNI
jgi:hypothetical protein